MKKVFNIAKDGVSEARNDEMIEIAKKILVRFFGEKHKEAIWSTLDSADYVYYDAETKRAQGAKFNDKLDFEAAQEFGAFPFRSFLGGLDELLKNNSNEQLEKMKTRELFSLEIDELSIIARMYMPSQDAYNDEAVKRVLAEHKDEIIDHIVSNRNKYAEYIALEDFFKRDKSVLDVSDKVRRKSLVSNIMQLIYGPEYKYYEHDDKVSKKLFELGNIYRTFKDESSLNLEGVPDKLRPGIMDFVKTFAAAEERAKKMIEDFKARTIEAIYESDFARHIVSLVQLKGMGVDGFDVGALLEKFCNMTLYANEENDAVVYCLGDAETLAYQIYCTLYKNASTHIKIHEFMHVMGLKIVADPDRKDVNYVLKNGISMNGRANAMNEFLTDVFACAIEFAVNNNLDPDFLPLGPQEKKLSGYMIYFPLVQELFAKYENEFKEAYVGDDIKPILDKIGKEKFYDLADSLDIIFELGRPLGKKAVEALIKDPENGYKELERSGDYNEQELDNIWVLSEGIEHVNSLVSELTSDCDLQTSRS